jgi:tetratricopeptide (TPR) repeat protein
VHYAIALESAKNLGLKHEQALLYSNLGFIYAYLPAERHKALSYCKASLGLWDELDDKRGKGRANSALGCVLFMAGQFDEALQCFQQALEIFEPVGDREWLSTVYSWRAAVYMSTRRLDAAEEDLQRSLEIGVVKDRPMNLSRLGGLYMMKPTHQNLSPEAIDECHRQAQKAIDECHSLALSQGNVLYQLISIRDLARLARHKKEFHRLEKLEQLRDDYLRAWPNPQDRRALGMLYLNLGSLALGQGKLDTAIGYYKEGLPPLTELDRYGRDTIEIHIERMEKVFVHELCVGAASIRAIGSALREFWQEKGFDAAHPEVNMRFGRWANWKDA